MSRVVGLDIGTTALRAAELKDPGSARPTFVRYLELPLAPGVVDRDEVRDRVALAAALKELWTRARFGTKDVVLGMGEHRIPSREMTVRAQPLDRVREQLPMLAGNANLLPIPVAEALLDFAPFALEETDEGPMFHGLLVAANREAVLTAVETVESAGLHVAGVDMIPFALARIFLGGPSRRGTVALVDIGDSTTHVLVAHDGVPEFVRAIGLGERDLVAAIDEMRLAAGLPALSGPSRPEEYVPISGELLAGIRDSLGFYRSSRPEIAIERLVVSGAVTRFPGIREAVAEFLQLPLAPAAFDERLMIARSAAKDPLTTAASAVSVGLAFGSTS